MNSASQSLHQPVASTSKVPDGSISLISKNTPSASTETRTAAPAHRLLWRGTLLSDTGTKLHGIAFVAHFPPGAQSPAFTLTRPLNPSQTATAKTFQDPFMSPLKQAQEQEREADANLCLDLEVMRHCDLAIQRTVELQQSASLSNPINKRKRGSLKSRIESLKKGNDGVEVAESSPNSLHINVYVDPRCSATKRWFERRFCEHQADPAGRSTKGLLLTLGGLEETGTSTTVVIYGCLQGKESSSTMQLKLGRKKVPPRGPVARPDDPLPRESLFAQKLRRTTSEPVLSFDKTSSSSNGRGEPSTFMRTKSMANGVVHSSVATGRNPFAAPREQNQDTLKRKESTAPPTPGRGRSGKRAKRTESMTNLSNVAEVEEEDAETPVMLTENGHVHEGTNWMERNKQTIKRLVAAELAKRKLSKQETEYKEVFTATSRGVQFALRHQASKAEVSRPKILALISSHLKMYLPLPS